MVLFNTLNIIISDKVKGVCSYVCPSPPGDHWCLKSMKSGFARAEVPCLKNLGVLSQRFDAKQITHETFKDNKESVCKSFQAYLAYRPI